MSEPTHRGRLDRMLAGSPLGVAGFRHLYGGAVSSSLGYTMQAAMAGWLMAGLSDSAFLVGMVGAASTMPYLLFGLISGSVADLIDRRWILTVTSLMMAASAAGIGVLSLTGLLQPWSLVALTLLCGLGYTFYQPAQQASINLLVPRALLARAVALGSIAFNAARSLGPAVAGLLAVWLGDGIAVSTAALFFLVMLPAAWVALPARVPDGSGREESLWAGILSGLRFSRHCTLLRVALLINFSFCFVAAALWAMFPLVAQQRLGLAADGYGVLYSTFGLGAVAAGLRLPRALSAGSPSMVVRGALLCWSVAAVGVAFSTWLPVAMLFTFMAGMGWVGVMAALSTVAQSVAPGWVRARAVANNQMSIQAGLALGSLFWGGLVNSIGLQWVLLLSAIVLLIFLGLSWRQPVALGRDADITPDAFLSDLRMDEIETPSWTMRIDTQADGGVCVSYRYHGVRTRPADSDRSHGTEAQSHGTGAQPVDNTLLSGSSTVPSGSVAAWQALRESRLRSGALDWQCQPDEEQGGVIERFRFDSMASYRRFASRMMQSDRLVFEAVAGLQ